MHRSAVSGFMVAGGYNRARLVVTHARPTGAEAIREVEPKAPEKPVRRRPKTPPEPRI